ncbi:MAG: hypothetical protein H6862_03025 [Rhodospirillales bacterium]|nr:hypothetical protein [Rhodospirillales bacterium]
MANNIIPLPNVQLVKDSEVPGLLAKIRPQWQSKDLITRVRRLLDVDPSSACQRIFNAAVHDLREKIVIAGIDIASEAASLNKLPPISKNEDVENYPTAKLLDLVYHMGLISRPEWRRLCRSYEIRRDLEHEDDEYEAGIADCVYIFGTCIDVVLSVDPVHLLKVKDVRDLVEQGTSAVPDEALLDDFERAPQPRQEEIIKFLLKVTLDKKQPDIVQQNAFTFLTYLEPLMHKQVKLKIGTHLQEKLGRNPIDERFARVANAAGVFSYLRQAARKDFFSKVFDNMKTVGHHWQSYDQHGTLLRSFIEYGAFNACPDIMKTPILKWLVLTYIGVPGGVTSYGNVRPVFYSNSAAPIIRQIISDASAEIVEQLDALREDKDIKRALSNQHVARRFEALVDLFSAE